MKGRMCFEYRWGLKPVLVCTLCHTNPIFDKRSHTPNNMPSRKRSNTYWSTNTFAPSVAICISLTICHRVSAQYVLVDQYVCPVGSYMYCPKNMSSVKRSNMYCSTNMSLIKRSNMYWPINMSSLKSSNMYWSTNMSSGIGSNIHWLHQYATKFNMIYNTYWNSYRNVNCVQTRVVNSQVNLNTSYLFEPRPSCYLLRC